MIYLVVALVGTVAGVHLAARAERRHLRDQLDRAHAQTRTANNNALTWMQCALTERARRRIAEQVADELRDDLDRMLEEML